MSGGLAPSKSTVYLSNLPFSLTNNDLCKILEKYGKVVKVTIVKDKVTRRSKGVAFVLFIEKESAHKCCHALNQTVMFGRTIRCNIARDNGRAAEFIRRKEYPDKSKCYECGEEGHLSYKCPKNLLGEREQPKKKDKKRRKEQAEDATYEDSDKESVTGEDPKQDSLAAAIQYQQLKNQDDLGYHGSALVLASASQDEDEPKKKRYKKDAYFSDEEEFADD